MQESDGMTKLRLAQSQISQIQEFGGPQPGCVADSHLSASSHMSATVSLPDTVDRVCLFGLSASGCSGNTASSII